MLYDPQNNTDLTQLEVCAAIGLVHRSLDNEIRSAAQLMRANNIIQNLSKELAQLRNTDVAGLQQTISKLNEQIRVLGSEREEVLQQFAGAKQREKSFSTENAELKNKIAQLQAQLNDLEAAGALQSSSDSKPVSKATGSKPRAPKSKQS